MTGKNISAELYWDEFGDIRCVQCLDGAKYEPMIEADLKILGEITHAFSRDLTCRCGRVVWNQSAGITEVVG